MSKVSKVLLGFFLCFLTLQLFSGAVYAAESGFGTVNASDVNLRSGPGKSFDRVGTLDKGDLVKILAQKVDWIRVSAHDGTSGWVKEDFVSLARKNTSRGGDRSAPQAGQMVAYAKQFLGVPYVWGGSSPDGFDCSGFVRYVYGKFGIELNRVSNGQAQQGSHVSKEDLSPGDLVFFATSGGRHINHAGIYIGAGKFIDASSGGGQVMISSLNEGFYANSYITARRMF